MPELVWIIDPASGDLVVEGLEAQEALALASDLLPSPKQLNCAQPLATVRLPRLRTAYAEHVVETVRKRLRGSIHRATEGSLVKLRVRY